MRDLREAIYVLDKLIVDLTYDDDCHPSYIDSLTKTIALIERALLGEYRDDAID